MLSWSADGPLARLHRAAPTLSVEVESGVIDAKALSPGDGFAQRRDGALVQLLDAAAVDANQMMVMRLAAPDVRGNVTRPLQAPGETRLDEPID